MQAKSDERFDSIAMNGLLTDDEAEKPRHRAIIIQQNEVVSVNFSHAEDCREIIKQFNGSIYAV